MRRIPDAPGQPTSTVAPAFTFTAPAERRAGRSDDELGLQCLARTLGLAAQNVSLNSLNAAEKAAQRTDGRVAADAARGLAEQITGQLRSLELALADVLPARR